MIEDRHFIRHTGIAILQVRNGVEWNPGQIVHLVVAIAAQSDEHIALLRRLTRLMPVSYTHLDVYKRQG